MVVREVAGVVGFDFSMERFSVESSDSGSNCQFVVVFKRGGGFCAIGTSRAGSSPKFGADFLGDGETGGSSSMSIGVSEVLDGLFLLNLFWGLVVTILGEEMEALRGERVERLRERSRSSVKGL